jgi:hypothetical protein
VIGCAFALAALAGAVAVPRARAIAAQQTRDAPAVPTTGTASLSGIVVDDRDPAQPVRRAVVTLTGAGLRPNRGAITDDNGRFAIRGLPAGHFTLMAERGGYVTSVYGARRPGRPGTEIAVADGQAIADLRVRLWRGAVIAGVVRDEAGQPVPNRPVAAIPAREVTPVGLTLGNSGQVRTNGDGEYRIFGLEPGTYIVRAGDSQLSRAEIAASEREVDAMLAALAARASRAGAVGAAAGTGPRALPMPEPQPIVNGAPFYHPGTPVAADATPVTVAPGQERAGIDIVVSRIRAATIRATIVGPAGTPAPEAYVRLSAVAGGIDRPPARLASIVKPAGPDGRLEMTSVSPGRYVLLVRGNGASTGSASGAGAGAAGGPFWWARVPFTVAGDDVDLGTLALQPGMTFSGRIVVDERAELPAPDLTGLRVMLESESLAPMPTSGRGGVIQGMRFLVPGTVRADGTFVISDLVPEDYRLTVTGAAIGGSTWWLRSALVGDRDLLDAPLRVAPGENISGVTLVLTDRRTELTGRISTAAGAAFSDLFVIAFPADAALRTSHSRRVKAVRPDSAGRYALTNLPAGDYLICALTDVDEGQWNEPGFLDSLVSASVKISIGDGARVVQDLRVGG